ncbi:MAG TPA: thiamine pyrophosphate-binding protein [Terriglobales bacterium]|nr:thiamine pyrophosphate-binding protein [Terriglobales bacterium]
MKLSDYVIRFVADLGVKHVFLVSGGGAMHLNDSLGRCTEIEFVCNHHEQASAIAAENYAKATNHLGVAMVTTGPGGTNAITGLAGAWFDSSPCLFLSGQVKRPDRMFTADGTPLGVRQRGIQELDIVSVVKSLTKYAVTVTDPNSIRYHLEKATHLALSGRPGPVWIDIPIDVQAAPIDEQSLVGFQPPELEALFDKSALPSQVAKAIEQLNQSERPLILAGNGVRLARAEKEFETASSRLGIPVETTWVSSDLVSEDDPLFVGRPGTLAARGANFALQNCDFLLIIGTRMDLPLTGWEPSQLARGAHKVMVDVDESEIRKLGSLIDTAIHADAAAFFHELQRQSSAIVPRDRQAWVKRCRDWKERYPLIQAEHRKPGAVSIFHFAEVLASVVEDDDNIVSGSSGSGIETFIFSYPAKKGQRVFHTAGLGSMGFGIPASIGVCFANDKRRTICVDGDGGFQFNIQELATIACHQLPVKFFVLNNDGYASIRASQTNFFGKPNIGCDDRTGMHLPALSAIARGFGIASAEISEQDDLAAQVRRVLEMPGPVVCDLKVIPDEPRCPRVTSVQRPDGSFVSKPLEDLWPFLDRDEFRANMIVPIIEEQ